MAPTRSAEPRAESALLKLLHSTNTALTPSIHTTEICAQLPRDGTYHVPAIWHDASGDLMCIIALCGTSE